MNWQSTLPTSTGFYFYEGETWPLHILSSGDDGLWAYTRGGTVKQVTAKEFPGRWCGPFTRPSLPVNEVID